MVSYWNFFREWGGDTNLDTRRKRNVSPSSDNARGSEKQGETMLRGVAKNSLEEGARVKR